MLTATYWHRIVQDFIVWIQINFYILKNRYEYNVRKWWLNMGWVLPCHQTLLLSRRPSCNSLFATWTQSFVSYVWKAVLKRGDSYWRTNGVYPFVRHSVRMQQHESYRTDFREISYLGLLLQFFNTPSVWWKSGRNNNLHGNLRICKISRRRFHNWDSHKLRRKKQLTIWT